ncbi:3,4-dihydroxy-2-butanone-4-phosphate synthase [Mycobacterium syngnathidarum]
MDTSPSLSVRQSAAAIAGGAMVIVTDDAERENEADLIMAAASATPADIAFMVRHTTGIICAPMPAARADALKLPLMVADNSDPHRTAFTVSVDHVDSGTGVSSADRALTLNALARNDTRVSDLRRPGHIFPLRARAGGVLERAGHTEAAVDLVRLGGHDPIAVISELVNDDGTMMRGEQVRRFAADHELARLSIAELAEYRRSSGATGAVIGEPPITEIATSAMPTVFGAFQAHAFRASDGGEHLALTLGDVAGAARSRRGVLARVHSECLTGDILGSLRCDCGAQLEAAFEAVATEGCGVVVYLRGHEGRGIGLASKISAYRLQDNGLDTFEANIVQGYAVDSRTYDIAADILHALDVGRIRLITNNPDKTEGIRLRGIEIVGQVASATRPNAHNIRYLRTKQQRMGHSLPWLHSSPTNSCAADAT